MVKFGVMGVPNEENDDLNTVNTENKKEKKSVCNNVTNSSGYNSSPNSDSSFVPHSRADFWLKASKNKPKPPS
ncbi:MAG: hypothetical protein HY959_09785 [Ignavibacteriae bacterium]|nr:hypothetical protein [Ignavibacteriota bacterium]